MKHSVRHRSGGTFLGLRGAFPGTFGSKKRTGIKRQPRLPDRTKGRAA